MILKLLYIIYLKSAKITLSVCVAVSKFVYNVNGGEPIVLSLCMFKTVRLLNCFWFILKRSHVTGNNSIIRQIQKKVAKIMPSLLTR